MGKRARYRPMRLAAKLLQIRLGLGLSQGQLARLLDVGLMHLAFLNTRTERENRH